MNLDRKAMAERLQAEALARGFDAAGLAPAMEPPGYARFLRWLDNGRAASMRYLSERALQRSHPSHLLEGVRSVLVVLASYHHPDPPPRDEPVRCGRVARYARVPDYHQFFWRSLESLLDWLRSEVPEVRGRAVCDSAPLLERDFAVMAGLGWIGKNTMLINRRLGSYTLIGALLLDADLAVSEPHHTTHCGTCTRCLEACPTGAFAGPYELDAGRCISHATIEQRGPLPEAMAEQLGGWVFGCDICQEVCPWNRKAATAGADVLPLDPELAEPDVIGWLSADPDEFRRWIRDRSLARARRAGLLRNAALVLGMRKAEAAIDGLVEAASDVDPTVRSSARWALERIGSARALEALARLDD